MKNHSIYDVNEADFDTLRRGLEEGRDYYGRTATNDSLTTLDGIIEKCRKIEAERRPHIGRLMALWAWASEEWAWDRLGEGKSQWYQGSWIVVGNFNNTFDDDGNACGTAYCCAGYGLHSLGLTDKEVRFLSNNHDRLLQNISNAWLGIGKGHGMYAGGNSINEIREYLIQFTGLDIPEPNAEDLRQRALLRREAEKIAREARAITV